MATGFYYLAAAPPASARIDVCGPGNFSSACAPNNTPSPQSAASRSAASRSAPQPTSAFIADPVPPPVVQSPAVIADPIPPLPVVQPTASPSFANIYINPPSVRSTAIPEPGTSIALLLTGAGMICGCRKRNKQVGQQR
ncbi:MAG TPA: PEP-CTERM sorting domain-containing protein [Microcoleaceae bacterium UBA9251]|nr:PEP-CTERM sorting domain-containing protein [Microcoleaceae cyanobacterium UBA9251]